MTIQAQIGLKRPNRLRKSQDFQRVRREGKSLARGPVVYLSCPGEHDTVRVGVSAGKGIGNAVRRNRAKRLLREAIRPLLMHVRPGRDIVLLARKSCLNESSLSLQKTLETLVKKSGDWIEA